MYHTNLRTPPASLKREAWLQFECCLKTEQTPDDLLKVATYNRNPSVLENLEIFSIWGCKWPQ